MPQRLLVTCLLLVTIYISRAHAQFTVREVPPGAKVTVEFDKKEFFLGENILAHFVVENTGKEAFNINVGGDYRGAMRHLRFSVTVTDDKGEEVADPYPSGICMGGIISSPSIAPGRKYYESLVLLRFARLEKPGIYKVRISHDLGWSSTKDRPLPVGEATLKVVMPDGRQARKIVEEMDKLPRNPSRFGGQRDGARADFSALRFPPYLPLMMPRADNGDDNALLAIGAMPDPNATAYLITLLEHRDPKIRLKAVMALYDRLPDPQLDEKLPKRSFFINDNEESRRWLVSQAWKPEFAPAVRRAAARLLDESDVESLQHGGFVLQCLGQKEDYPALVAGLNRATQLAEKSAPESGIYPRPRGACMEMIRAATAMIQRGLEPPEKLPTPGDRIVFALALKHGKDFRPEGWKETTVGLLRDDSFLVKETTLRSLADPSEPLFVKPLCDLLFDRDIDVRLAACQVAQDSTAKDLNEPLRRLLKSATEEQLFSAANSAAVQHLPRVERLRIIVDRLEENDMSSHCLSELHEIVTGWSSLIGPGALDKDQAAACKKAWLDFLQKQEKELSEGRSYPFDDPSIPLRRLFPTTTFEGRRKTA